MTTEVSIIVPMYNEEEGCSAFFDTVVPLLEANTSSYEIVCINDGSADGTLAALHGHRLKNPNIRVIDLSRNFGKEAALTAGIDLCEGKAVIPMDADLQDPPDLIVRMLEEWRKGAMVVLARRVDRSSDSFLKRLTSSMFYKVFSSLARPSIPENVGDFRLMDRRVVEVLKKLPERTRFMKGLFAWVGFDPVVLDYTRPERTKGDSKFNYVKLWNFALEGLFSFSSLPLKVWSYVGVFLSLFAASYMAFLVTRTLITGVDVPGYTSIMTVLLLFNGIILISLGALGEYVSRVFLEVKQRPIYVIRSDTANSEDAAQIERSASRPKHKHAQPGTA